MRFLITGGANRLQGLGHYVRVLDDVSSGHPERLDGGINFNRGDVSNIPKLWTLLQGVDVVYHLAARVSVPASVLYPREYNDVNVGGTVALLEACRDVGIKRFVLSSSGAVYGEHKEETVCEETRPQPKAPYAVSKIAAEQYMFSISEKANFESVALRIFNAYGPGQAVPPTHPPVIPEFMQQILGHGSLIVNGSGEQIRDFVFIDDVVTALIAASDAPNVDREIINVGSGVGTSINQLIAALEEVTGQSASVLNNSEGGKGISRLVADIDKAARLLQVQPSTDLLTGLQRLMREDPIIQRIRQGR